MSGIARLVSAAVSRELRRKLCRKLHRMAILRQSVRRSLRQRSGNRLGDRQFHLRASGRTPVKGDGPSPSVLSRACHAEDPHRLVSGTAVRQAARPLAGTRETLCFLNQLDCPTGRSCRSNEVFWFHHSFGVFFTMWLFSQVLKSSVSASCSCTEPSAKA